MSRVEEIIASYLEAVENGDQPNRESLIAENPDFRDALQEFFSEHERMQDMVGGHHGKSLATEGINRPTDGDQTEVYFPAGDDEATAQTEALLGANFGAGERRVIGHYEVVEEIDRGGMGIVYRADDLKLNRQVALKMIRAGRLASDSDIQRFRAEAKAAARLDHPGIVAVHDVGTHEGHPYFSMAFIEGEKLDVYHRRVKLSVTEACAMVREIALAIDHAHENELVHRDLKPANVLVDAQGKPKITDFGLAKSLDQDEGLTGTGEILGTINFMAPEQAAARHDQVSPMTDVYSLGAILYFLCTGRVPFQTENPVDTLLKILDAEPTMANRLNKQVPGDVAAICQRCLEKDPQDRYASARDLANELDRFLRGEPVEATNTGMTSRLRRWSRREPSLAGHLAGLGLIELTRAFDYAIGVLYLGIESFEYLRFSYIIVTWMLACFVLQKLQNRAPQNSFVISFTWAAVDILFLTVILLMAESHVGPLYIAYPLVIVVSGFFTRVRLVTFTTLLCLISFSIVFLNSDDSLSSQHYGVVGAAAILTIGIVIGSLVHRIRLLNRLFE